MSEMSLKFVSKSEMQVNLLKVQKNSPQPEIASRELALMLVIIP